MTTDPIGELIEAAKESETDRSALVMLRLHNAIAAVEQMRRETKRPEVVPDGRGNFRYYKPSDTDPLLDLLLGGK